MDPPDPHSPHTHCPPFSLLRGVGSSQLTLLCLRNNPFVLHSLLFQYVGTAQCGFLKGACVFAVHDLGTCTAAPIVN